MKKLILNQEQVYQLIKENYFPASIKDINCRCIDGRYDKNLKSLPSKVKINRKEKIFPALTIPGGDIGQLAILLAAANNFGFKINKDKLLKTYEEFLAGWQNFHLHSDDHHSPSTLAAGCGYYNLIKNQPEKFYLQTEDIDFIDKQLATINQKTTQVLLHGEHDEGAVVLVKGEVGIYPRYVFTINKEGERKKIETSVFVFNYTLFNHRQRLLAKKLINKKVIQLFSGLDEEYLVFALTETTDIHLFETLNQLGKNLPVYEVIFDENFKFKIKLLDKINE